MIDISQNIPTAVVFIECYTDTLRFLACFQRKLYSTCCQSVFALYFM